MLEHGAEPHSGHLLADSTSAITTAAQRGRIDLSELLVHHDAKVSSSGALAGAAEAKHIETVWWLLDRGAGIDDISVSDFGDRRKEKCESTAFYKVAANGDVGMAKLLVGRGTSLIIRDPMHRKRTTKRLPST